MKKLDTWYLLYYSDMGTPADRTMSRKVAYKWLNKSDHYHRVVEFRGTGNNFMYTMYTRKDQMRL